MAEPTVTVRVKLEQSETQKSLKQLTSAFKYGMGEVKATLDILGKSFRVFEKVVKEVSQVVSTAIKLAGANSVATQRQLNQITKSWEKLQEQFGTAVAKSSALKL